jgi:hypothetical protein
MRKKQREFTNRELDINTIKKDYERIKIRLEKREGLS